VDDLRTVPLRCRAAGSPSFILYTLYAQQDRRPASDPPWAGSAGPLQALIIEAVRIVEAAPDRSKAALSCTIRGCALTLILLTLILLTLILLLHHPRLRSYTHTSYTYTSYTYTTPAPSAAALCAFASGHRVRVVRHPRAILPDCIRYTLYFHPRAILGDPAHCAASFHGLATLSRDRAPRGPTLESVRHCARPSATC